ncbi:hypothetical protein ACFL12_03005 [Pseudomonadota bacterium]
MFKSCKSMSPIMGLALLTAALTPLIPMSANAANICAERSERAALDMRVLQSELMVAALTCGQRSEYNTFVSVFKPHLKQHGAKLQGFFAKAYGNGGSRQLNRMVTRLANQASSRTLSQPTSQFCAQAQSRFKMVLNASPTQLAYIARTNPAAAEHGYRSCVEVAEGESSVKQPSSN